MTKKEYTSNTLSVALPIGVAIVICHLKEKLKIISAPRPTHKGQELITSGCPLAANKYHSALDFLSISSVISFPAKMLKLPFSNLQSVNSLRLSLSVRHPLRYLVGNHTRL